MLFPYCNHFTVGPIIDKRIYEEEERMERHIFVYIRKKIELSKYIYLGFNTSDIVVRSWVKAYDNRTRTHTVWITNFVVRLSSMFSLFCTCQVPAGAKSCDCYQSYAGPWTDAFLVIWHSVCMRLLWFDSLFCKSYQCVLFLFCFFSLNLQAVLNQSA